MNKIYILEEDIWPEGFNILGVYSTQELAETAMQALLQRTELCLIESTLDIVPYDIDQLQDYYK